MVQLGQALTDELPQGHWPSLLPGGSSANALTPDGLSDRGGGGDFHDARVEVEKA